MTDEFDAETQAIMNRIDRRIRYAIRWLEANQHITLRDVLDGAAETLAEDPTVRDGLATIRTTAIGLAKL